jgi:hypothetical protein
MSSSSPPSKRRKLSTVDLETLVQLPPADFDREVEALENENLILALQLVKAKAAHEEAKAVEEKAKADAAIAEERAKIVKERAKSQDLKAEVEEIKQKLLENDFRSAVRIGTRSERAKRFNDLVPGNDDGGFTWKSPSPSAVLAAWKNVKESVPVSTTFSNENSDLHPVFHSILEKTTESLRLQLSIKERPTSLYNPCLIPDIVIGERSTSIFSWADVHILFELKLPGVVFAHAVSETIDYVDEALAHRKSAQRTVVGIASDFNHIQTITAVDKFTSEALARSEVLELFPAGWESREHPTPGYELLCHALMIPLPRSKLIRINNLSVVVVGTLQAADDIAAYVVNSPLNGRPVAVKVAYSKMAIGVMRCFEKPNYETLSSITALDCYMVKRLDQLDVENGYAMELANPLIRWFEMQAQGAVDKVAVANTGVKPHLRHVFHGLRTLHAHSWSHRDVRPANIVIIDGTARLIDWATAARHDRPVSCLFDQGHGDPFAPNDISKFGCHGAKLDLVGLGFVALFFGSAEVDQKRCIDSRSREQYMSDLVLTCGSGFPTDLATIGARLVHEVEQTASRPLTDDDYDRWESWFA